MGATPRTTLGRRGSRCGGLDRPRLLVVAAVLSMVVSAASPAVVGASADAGRAVRATAPSIRSWGPCEGEGESGPGLGPVSCGLPENEETLSCSAPSGEGCLVRLIVKVEVDDSSNHDLGVSGQIFNHRFPTKKCDDTRTCEDTYTAVIRCGDITGEALGYQYAKVGFLGLRDRKPFKIKVYGRMIFERLVPYPEQARSAHAAAAGCAAPAPLEVLVHGVATDDPLALTPIASGYGNVSVSRPKATVRCPYVTDYRSCFGEWRLPRGAKVTLTAIPDPTNRSFFVGWRGTGSFNCRSSSLTCTVTVGKVSRVTALFGAPIYKLTIDNTQNPNAGQVVPSGFSNLGPTLERIACGLGVNDCTAYYPLVDSHTIPNFNGPEPLSLAQNGVITDDNQQWYIQFVSGCDSVQVVVDGSNRYTVCYYHMTSDRTITVRWTDTPP